MDPLSLALAFSVVLLGGILKGAIGAGAPVVAVPILSILYGVPFAISVFVLPNLMSNLWQGWQYRHHLTTPRLAWLFTGAGGLGALIGSVMLAALPADLLMRVVAFAVLIYVVFRLARPVWRMSPALGLRLALPVGLLGGILQGAGGISAPISVTFLNAMKLERPVFIATISLFFLGTAVVQVPALVGLGILTPERFLISVLAVAPLLAGMPLGAVLVRHVRPEIFDRLILWLLVAIAVKLIVFPDL